MHKLTELDEKIIFETQDGIPETITPYLDIAKILNISETQLIDRLNFLKENGVIRRVALVPNHYKIGYVFNGMTVWKIKEESITKIGEKFAKLGFVSHCYKRKSYPGVWEYNLFAMVHGTKKSVCEEFIKQMKEIAGEDCIDIDTLYSTEILKKTGLRITR